MSIFKVIRHDQYLVRPCKWMIIHGLQIVCSLTMSRVDLWMYSGITVSFTSSSTDRLFDSCVSTLH